MKNKILKSFILTLLIIVPVLFSGCGARQEQSTEPEQELEDTELSSDDSTINEELNEAPEPVKTFFTGDLQYVFEDTDLLFEKDTDIISVDYDGRILSSDHYFSKVNDEEIASMWYFEYDVDDNTMWASPGDNIMSYFSKELSLNKEYNDEDEPETIREYNLTTLDYVIQSKTFIVGDDVIFDMIAMTKADIIRDDDDKGEVYYVSIISKPEGTEGLFSNVLVDWNDEFSKEIGNKIERLKVDSVLSYMTGKKTATGNSIIDKDNNFEGTLDIRLDTADSLSPEIQYENGISVLTSLKNTKDTQGWKSQMVEANSSYIRNFMGIYCELQTFNDKSSEASVADLPLKAIWLDCNMGILYINNQIINTSYDIKEIFGMPYYSSILTYDDGYIVSWYHKYGDDFIYTKFENENILEFGIINKEYAEISDELGKLDDIIIQKVVIKKEPTKTNIEDDEINDSELSENNGELTERIEEISADNNNT